MPQTVRIVCTVKDFESFWVEYDVSTWDLGTYFELYDRLNVPQLITEFIPRYSINWRIVNTDGVSIAHPGAGARATTWRNVWSQIDVETSRALFGWLWVSALTAMQEAMALPPKSAADDTGDGAGTQDAAGPDADEDAG